MKITEDSSNIYIEDYIIPKGREKADIKTRENIIWEMYGRWCLENPDKKCYNEKLKRDIYVTFSGISETVEKAARNYKSTMAFWNLNFVLRYAYQVGEDKTKSKRQKDEKYYKMLIFQADTAIFKPYFYRIKLIIGVKKSGRTNMYCITAIENVGGNVDVQT